MQTERDLLVTEAKATLRVLQTRLRSSFDPRRPWTGHLSDSAVATSVAAVALNLVDARAHHASIERGVSWLVATQRAEGGWGDSPESPSNLAATLLAWCALGQTPAGQDVTDATCRARAWLTTHLGSLTPRAIADGIYARYGGDRTFAAPLLSLAAVAGRMGPPRQAWHHVPQLPFELAALPPACFRWLNLPVVSYALPALIAVGLLRHRHRPTRNPVMHAMRNHLSPRLLDIARRMQPAHGGYEEAAPLTGFITLSLAAAGYREHPIVDAGIRFLLKTQRHHGSWPIDTDLATWVTTHATTALVATSGDDGLSPHQRQAIRRWLLDQQHTGVHPLTSGAPGGWGWTDLPGAMPDADDTAGVLLALHRLGATDAEVIAAAQRGVQWLMDLQNRDGGIPTFARGWGRLPFDRSSPDLTAHALQACTVWQSALPSRQRLRVRRSIHRMLRFLMQAQSQHGAWTPLWFGTQAHHDEANPVFGTARTVPALAAVREAGFQGVATMLRRGQGYLIGAQNTDGGWGAQGGTPSTIEETSVALRALAADGPPELLARGVRWLVHATRGGHSLTPSPIGLYFARLWYAEELYPVVFSASALAAVLPRLRD